MLCFLFIFLSSIFTKNTIIIISFYLFIYWIFFYRVISIFHVPGYFLNFLEICSVFVRDLSTPIFIIVITKCPSLQDFPPRKFGESHDFFPFPALGVRQACKYCVCILTREGWHGKIGGRSAKKHKGSERSAISCVLANSSGYNTDLLVTPERVTKSPLKNRVMSFLCFNLEFIPFSPKIWIFFDS